jgi:hypothetical protein
MEKELETVKIPGCNVCKIPVSFTKNMFDTIKRIVLSKEGFVITFDDDVVREYGIID